jgi:hypothetical protein
MAKKRHYDGEYAGEKMRRKEEMRDAGMLHDDKSAVANMPQSVIYKPYGGDFKGFDSNIDDTISGIKRQQDMDESVAKRHNVPKKW